MSKLLRWQWEGYSRYHPSRSNLALHIVLVPVFLITNVALVVTFVQRSWLAALVAFAAMVVSVALQGRGHRKESVSPEPFTSPLNAMSHFFCEQWVTFPRFAISGGWHSAMRVAR